MDGSIEGEQYMKADLQQNLYNKYHEIFRERDFSIRESCMAWGLQCDDGWYDLIGVTCEALSYLYTTGISILPEDIEKYGGGEDYRSVEAPKVIFTTVKEKFGVLRIYHRLEWPPHIGELIESGRYPNLKSIVDGYSNYVDGVIHMAEIMSSHTCELSGRPGEMHVSSSGWYKTLNKEVAQTDEWAKSRGFRPLKDVLKEREGQKL